MKESFCLKLIVFFFIPELSHSLTHLYFTDASHNFPAQHSNCIFPAVTVISTGKYWEWLFMFVPTVAACEFQIRRLVRPSQVKCLLFLLQIMIEFCPGGAVDATMLGRPLSLFSFCFIFVFCAPSLSPGSSSSPAALPTPHLSSAFKEMWR